MENLPGIKTPRGVHSNIVWIQQKQKLFIHSFCMLFMLIFEYYSSDHNNLNNTNTSLIE